MSARVPSEHYSRQAMRLALHRPCFGPKDVSGPAATVVCSCAISRYCRSRLRFKNIRLAARTESWISGDADTIPQLESEHFDFRSRAAGDLLATAAQAAPDAVVLGLLERGAPSDGLSAGDEEDVRLSAIEGAAMNGRLMLMKRLIAAGAFTKGGKDLISANLAGVGCLSKSGCRGRSLKVRSRCERSGYE